VSIQNKLILALAVAFSIINIVLALMGQDDLAIYFILDCVAYFVVVLAFINLNPGAKGVLNRMSVVLFVGFIVTVALKISLML
jgi:hypothetical protein